MQWSEFEMVGVTTKAVTRSEDNVGVRDDCSRTSLDVSVRPRPIEDARRRSEQRLQEVEESADACGDGEDLGISSNAHRLTGGGVSQVNVYVVDAILGVRVLPEDPE
jgi:hypothetical protein